MCAIDVRDIDPNAPITPPVESRPSKADFSVGETVTFINRSVLKQSGLIICLNRKATTVQGISWRVYSLCGAYGFGWSCDEDSVLRKLVQLLLILLLSQGGC